ncbi:glutathione S-transferase family protein [Phenylobacterium sp.]|jgi:glutathione S-transferase|uniref:glutathione S-transferase family protein n=1 Tax=Phenylobacterium sp. TaxID=1871053 RepID=UPI002F3F80FB
MAARRGITLYHSPASRAFITYWMLEELGVPFRVETVDIRKGQQKSPAYLKLNPSGKVPTLTDGKVVVSETAAICLYLADRYSYGALAPKLEAPARGPYLQWMVYATAVLEPARSLHGAAVPTPPGGWGPGWQPLPQVLDVLQAALKDRDYLLGDRFSTADVMLGATLSMGLLTKEIPEVPVLADYNQRLARRPAYNRAADATWPPDLFARDVLETTS